MKIGPGEDLDALLLKRFGQLGADLFVFDGQQPRQQFDDRRVRAEAREHRSELDADRARAQNNKGFRHLFQFKQLVAGDDMRAVYGQIRQRARHRPRRDDRVFGAHGLSRAAGVGDGDLARLVNVRRALDDLHLVLLHQELDALGALQNDLALVLLRLLEVELNIADGDADALSVLELVVNIGGVQQGFRRDAAAQQTGAAEILVLFDDRRAQSQLSGADRSHITARPRANDDQIKRVVCAQWGECSLTPATCGLCVVYSSETLISSPST